MDLHPIGLFDSGVGGLTIWRQVEQVLPNEDLIYLADQAHCPYGARPLAEICELAVAATRFLLRHNVKAIVVACNTASAAALENLRATFADVPFVGMEPAIKPAAQSSQVHKIGVLATRGTLVGDLFIHTRSRLAQHVEVITQTAEGLVEKIEAGELDSLDTEHLLRHYLKPFQDAGVDRIVLGCTHYPLVMPLIRQIVGNDIALIDPSAAVAVQVQRILNARNAQNNSTHEPRYRFFTTGDTKRFSDLMQKVVGIHAVVEAATLP